MLSIITPTYNERDNLELLAQRIFATLADNHITGELIVVDDDSPDGTADLAETLKEKYPMQVLRRKTRGLASAVIDGFKVARYDILAFIDADLSHPPEVLSQMYQLITSGQADIVVGSRLAPGGGSKDWPLRRRFISWFARIWALPLTNIKDVGSGYYMLRRSVIEGVKLNPIGFKIGLEIVVKGNYSKAVEVPIIFHRRFKGKSKLGWKEVLGYYLHLMQLYPYKFLKGKDKW